MQPQDILKEAVTATPAPPAVPNLIVAPTEDAGADDGKSQVAPTQVVRPRPSGLWGYVMPVIVFLGVLLLVVFLGHDLLMHWQITEARADAQAAYLKRRAELRAEAEHADERLQVLDKRIQLVSLGFREVVRKVAPQVVNVTNMVLPTRKEFDPFVHAIPIYDVEKGQKYFAAGVGSGIIVKPGCILTNHHVIKGADRLRITFASGQFIGVDPAAVASDTLTDLSVIRLPADLPEGVREDLKFTAEFADSDKDVQVGDWAVAVGSPLGLRQTVTHGVISAKGRLLSMLLVELLQTDAAINPGNSGGPLFDQLGRVVGVNVAIATDNGRNQGIGFAIPSNDAHKIMDKLLQQGEVPRGYLGIALEDATGPRLKELDRTDGGGVVVVQVLPDQAAVKAGLLPADMIVRFENEILSRIEPGRHLRQLVAQVEPGTDVKLEIIRGGERMTVTATVGKRPANLQ